MESEDEYLLKWRDYQSNFFSLAEELFEGEDLTDVTLCCGDHTTFQAHRLVLSVCSPHFRRVFAHAQQQSGRVFLFLHQVSGPEMERLLHYMYYGEVKIPHADLEAFIRAANGLCIRGLCSLQQQR